MKNKVVLLDFSALIYKSYYALPNLKNSNDQPVGAVLGFTNILLRILREFKPDIICAAFDVKRSSLKRSEMFDSYKSQRKPMPEDLVLQLDYLKNLLNGFNIKGFEVVGEEADDVLGSLSKIWKNKGSDVYILTGDKDISQVIEPNISIALINKSDANGKYKIIKNDKDVIDQLGVIPSMIPDLFGLIGDSCDGIPGVKKVGPKKAIPLLDKYGSLESIYENINELGNMPGIGKGLIKNLINDKELAFISRDLAIIDTGLDVDISECERVGLHKQFLYEMFKELELNSLINKLKLGVM